MTGGTKRTTNAAALEMIDIVIASQWTKSIVARDIPKIGMIKMPIANKSILLKFFNERSYKESLRS